MMKRQEYKQRFYLWDYLWWQGEMIKKHHDRPGMWIDGSFGLMFYITALIIVPLIFLSDRIFPDAGFLQLCLPFCIITVVATIWTPLIYSTRGKVVMKHYAKRKFNPVLAYFLTVIFPLIILVILTFALVPTD